MNLQDESHDPLNKTETPHDAIHINFIKDKKPRPWFLSPWLACLAFTIFASVVAFRLLGSFAHERTEGTLAPYFVIPDHIGQLSIPLHPAEHSARGPTTLTFEWNITLGWRAPDGVEKQVYLINGQFPGPTIEARSGDRIIVRIHNGLETEGVSLHWHGLRMQGFNAMDGAVGFTQCPIPAGGDFVYDFRIGDDEHGTFWWHSHSQVQRGDGLFGGLVVHQPRRDHDSAPGDEAILLVGDWFHRKQTEVLAWYANAANVGNEPVPDSILINGRGRYNCSMAVPARPVQCSPVTLDSFPPLLQRSTAQTRLRIINTGTIAGLTLAVDGASLQPLEVDGGCPVDAQPTDSIGILYPGERVDLALGWKEDHPEPPWLNIYLDDENFGFRNPALNPNHTFPALPETLDVVDEGQGPPPLELGHRHQNLATLSSTKSSSPVIPVSAEETIVFYLKTQKLSVHGNQPMGFINHTSWRPQAPPLLSQNRSSWDSRQFVPFIGAGSEPTNVKLVLNNLDDGSHPVHLHGYSFHVLSSYRAEGRNGFGSYNPYETPEDESPGSWNRDKPLQKDTISVPRRGHVVLTFMADNPGIWMLHCHMLVHTGAGMAAGFHIGDVDDEEHVDGLDASVARLCDAAK